MWRHPGGGGPGVALGTLGGALSGGYGINASGQVVGSAGTSGGETHAFLYDGTMHDLGTLGGALSGGYGINASGQVSGYSITTGGDEHAFLYDGTMHDLGTLGGTTSVGGGINKSAQVTGFSYITGGAQHAFLFDAAHGMVDLNSLINPSSGWVLGQGIGINDAGQITGFGTIDGENHAFLLTPVPEPRAGDANGDGKVTGADYTIWAVNFNRDGGWSQGDFNGDGRVTGADYTIWAANFNPGAASMLLAVPEPSGLLLSAVGGVLLLGWRTSRSSH